MRRPSRIRRIAKWTGLVLCVLVVVAWGVSVKWEIELDRSDSVPRYTYGLISGRIALERYDWISLSRGLQVYPTYARDFGLCLPIISWPADQRELAYAVIPLWIPFVLLAVPTAFLWHRDRRPPRGHCRRCGYNLKGNLSGTCPECGEPT
jgi:hypothetical protein